VAQRLTDKAVARAKVRAKSYALWDAKTTGLSLKITRSGKRVWRFQSIFPGHDAQTRRTLGVYPALGLEAARKKAQEWHALVKNGHDPQEVEEEKQRVVQETRRAKALQDATTFAAVAERFIKEHLAGQRRGKAGAREVQYYLIKAWGDRPIASITPQDVKALIGTLKMTAPYQARNVFGHTGVLFKWAVHNDLLAGASPTASLSKKLLFSGAKIGPRQRVLDQDEIAAFWRATGKMQYPYGPLYRLLLLTGCRLNEIAKARWSELHPDLRKAIREAAKLKATVNGAALPPATKTLTIPRERFKSDATHVVPLSDDALAILASLPRFGGDFIFTTTDGRKAINGMSNAKERLDRSMLRSLKALALMRGDDPVSVALKPFIVHDLRRVVRSHLSALDIPDHIAEMVLGHGRRGLQRVYDQHKYEQQIREALEKWAARLRELTAPPSPAPPTADNVVELAPKKRAS
jgi:integrase